MVFGPRLSSCPSCNSSAIRIGGREIEPARKVQAVTVSDVHILAQAMINGAPDGHKKLIVFADSRQDAAFQAGWMQDHARRIRLRHMMYQAIAEGTGPQAVAGIRHHLVERFRADRSLIESLLPELTTEEWPFGFGPNNWQPLIHTLRYMVLREFTTGVRRLDCLEAMGLARVVYDGLSPTDQGLRDWADMLGIAPDEAVEAVSLILDSWRRNRCLNVPEDPIFSHYHAKDDPYIQSGLLPLREFRPEGLLLSAGAQRPVCSHAAGEEGGNLQCRP